MQWAGSLIPRAFPCYALEGALEKESHVLCQE